MNAVVKSGARGATPMPVLQPQSFGELMEFAKMAAGSDLMPKDFRGKPGNIMIAVQMGSELGLAPMQAIQNIAVVNGRPSVWGDALPALCRQSSVCDDIEERIEGEGDKMVAICIATRSGKKPVRSEFSVDDAKKAGLWSKQGPWTQYPKRMLQMRARGFALRDAFPDVLKGLITAEEASDIPPDNYRGTVIDVTPERPPAPQQRVTEERRPIDYEALFDARLLKCMDMACVDGQWKAWDATVQKAQDAGRPIAPEVVERVRAMISDRMADMQQIENQRAAEHAEADAEEVPA